MKEVTIRRAQEDDCAQILHLVRELAEYERAPDEVTVSLENFADSGFGEQPVWWAFVAAVPNDGGGERLLGFALYYIRFSTWKGQRMYLEDLIVTNDARGKGIGMMLMNALVKEAKERQFSAIVWQVLHWNEPAINFYKKLNASFDHEWVNCSIQC